MSSSISHIAGVKVCAAKLHGNMQDVYALFLCRLAVLCGPVQMKACIANTHNSTSRSSAEGLVLGLLFQELRLNPYLTRLESHRTAADTYVYDAWWKALREEWYL